MEGSISYRVYVAHPGYELLACPMSKEGVVQVILEWHQIEPKSRFLVIEHNHSLNQDSPFAVISSEREYQALIEKISEEKSVERNQEVGHVSGRVKKIC